MGNNKTKLSPDDLAWIQEKTGKSTNVINKAFTEFRKDLEEDDTELNFENFCKKASKIQGKAEAELNNDEKESFRHFFRAFDRNGNGTIDFREFFLGIIVIGKDGLLDKEEALRLVFRLYDVDNRKLIQMNEAVQIWNKFNIYETDQDKELVEIDEETFVRKSLARLESVQIQHHH